MSNHEQVLEFNLRLEEFLRENGVCMERHELGIHLILLGVSIFHDACKVDGIKFTDEMILIKNTISKGMDLADRIPYKYGQPKDI